MHKINKMVHLIYLMCKASDSVKFSMGINFNSECGSVAPFFYAYRVLNVLKLQICFVLKLLVQGWRLFTGEKPF